MAWAGNANAAELTGTPSIRFDIKPQPLTDALTEWANSSGLQIIAPEEPGMERRTHLVRGVMTAQEALEQLLANTRFTFEQVNARTVAITVDYSRAIRPGHQASDAAARRALEDPPRFASARIQEVMVTGSRLRGDIRTNGTVEVPAPVVVIDRERLDQMGVSGTADMLRLATQQPYNFDQQAFGNAGQFAALRGLGHDTTLILINGRRTIPSAISAVFNALDLNTIPLAAVERVEILSDSASAVYGTDAVGGVINFILKSPEDIPRPVFDFNYGTARGGAEERRFSLSASYANERMRGSIVLDVFDRGVLLGEKRDRWNNQDFRRFGGQDFRTFTGNVSSLTSTNLPGLPSGFAAIPAGSTGIGLTPRDFLSTAGQRNSDSLLQLSSIIPGAQRRTLVALADFNLTNTVNVFSEIIHFDESKLSLPKQRPQTLIVPAGNPFNPFDVDVAVDYVFPTWSARAETERYRALAGLRGTLRDCDWELSLLRTDDSGSFWYENEVEVSKVNAALAATDPALALNVFADGSGSSPELLGSLVAEPVTRPYLSVGNQVAGVLRSGWLTLPAGTVNLVLGGEWLGMHMMYSYFGASRNPRSLSHERSVAAGFAELHVPLASQDMQIPAIYKLSLNVAARHDRYSDFGNTFNPEFGLVWMPSADWVLRSSYGTSFRAPSIFELHLQRTYTELPLPDLLRNNEATKVMILAGGNPDLKPVEATSLTAGFDFTPTGFRELKLSFNYWHIAMEKRVDVLAYEVLAESWERFPNWVTRAPPTPEDIAAGLPGRLTFIDLSQKNLGVLTTSGVDLSADLSWDTVLGRFRPNVSVTWVNEYLVRDIPGMQAINRVSIGNPNGTIPRWRAVATLGWEREGMSISMTARHTTAYKDLDLLRMAATGSTVPSQTLIDLQGALELNKLLGQNSTGLPALKLTAGMSNLLDDAPPFSEVGFDAGYDFSQADLWQRFGYLRISAQF